jgi:hypothetical protein
MALCSPKVKDLIISRLKFSYGTRIKLNSMVIRKYIKFSHGFAPPIDKDAVNPLLVK